MKNLALVFFYILLSGCYSLIGLEDGKTIGKSNIEVEMSYNRYKSPNILYLDTIQEEKTGNIESLVKYGLTEKLDVGLRLSILGYAGLYAKYHLIGQNEALFNLAVGIDGNILIAPPLSLAFDNYQITLPLYMSFHPKENITIYITPKYSYYSNYSSKSRIVEFKGGNMGLKFGKKVKVGLDFGIFQTILHENRKNNFTTYTFGIGVSTIIPGDMGK